MASVSASMLLTVQLGRDPVGGRLPIYLDDRGGPHRRPEAEEPTRELSAFSLDGNWFRLEKVTLPRGRVLGFVLTFYRTGKGPETREEHA